MNIITKQESIRNSIDTLSQQSARNFLISDQYSPNLQLYKLNLFSHLSPEPTTIDSSNPSNNSPLSGNFDSSIIY